jgi:choline dehydrogenase-like flavoprotein
LLVEIQYRAYLIRLKKVELVLEHVEEAKHFDGFASVKGLKSDAERALLDRVAPRDKLQILTGQLVRDLLGADDSPQRITGVALEDGRRFGASTVVLAAGALHSPRLLQRYLEASALTSRLPSSRLVGRNYKCHLLTALLAVSPSRKTDVLCKTALWLNERLPHSSIQPLGFDGEAIASLLPRVAPRWFANTFGQRAYGFFLQTEDGSDESNRVMAKANGAATPEPSPRLDYDPARLPQAVAEHRQLTRAFRRSLLRAGYTRASLTAFSSRAQPTPAAPW